MKNLTFNSIDWKKCHHEVARLQEKIAVAYKGGEKEKVISLQNELTNSFWGRAVAVKKVITNRGKNTPGVDSKKWTTNVERFEAIESLKGKYKALPLKRIYILKTNGKLRPLSIPTMKDRAMQALHAMALDPIAEIVSDIRSYGFRKHKGCHDAIAYLYNAINGTNRAKYILEGDISQCFEKISHEWILKNIPMDKKILKEFIKAGFIDKNVYQKIEEGVPQGGIISPIIANMALTGLEAELQKLKKYKPYKESNPKINYVRYADDFVVTGATPEILKEKVLPVIEGFLHERGLTLNKEKTLITNVKEGFDFLGVTFKEVPSASKTSGQIHLMFPSRKSVQKIKEKIALTIKENQVTGPGAIIARLNPILRGWANYFRIVFAKTTFNKLDHFIWQRVWHWAVKRHRNRRKEYIMRKYFTKIKNRKWIFFFKRKITGTIVNLLKLAKITVGRHKICLNKNPYLSENKTYYEKRTFTELGVYYGLSVAKLLKREKGKCQVCEERIKIGQEIDIHHKYPKRLGGKNILNNLIVLHTTCHKLITNTKDPKLRARYVALGLISQR